ncbi:MAG: asparagine synthase (glutamine-hydrolyzing) [Candidatus Peribacteraceae bacterium]
MCGIAGIAAEKPEAIQKMVKALVHRGPDGNAMSVVNGASLGHARLAILDPSPRSDQPMWNEKKTMGIVFNGEIYNFKALRAEEGFACSTESDTEVVLKLFEKYGTKFLPRLHGMFAFAVVNTATGTWTLVRDAQGIKPLYIAYPNGILHFASEMRSLMTAFSVKPALNMRALSAYLRLQYVPGPMTMCEGIESLPPGTVLTWKGGKETRETYAPAVRTEKQQSNASSLRETIGQAVHAEMISDRPIGIFLSGGMDSSIVLHHMAEKSSSPVRTFTVRFDATEQEGAARFNADADLAALTAKHYKTEHRELLLTAEMFREHYKETALALDQPNSDHVSVAQFLLAREAKKSVDVVLTGAGGDELFGGYPRYRIAKILHDLRFLPSQIRSLGSLFGYPADVLKMSPGAKLMERLLARPTDEWSDIVRGNWFEPSVVTNIFEKCYKNVSGDALTQAMECDRTLWLVDESLKLVDGTTMASGLEARVPLLAPSVRAHARSFASSRHLTWCNTKVLLKNAYRDTLPSHLYSLKKASFYPPLAKWFRRESAPLIEEALKNKRIQELFDTEKIRVIAEDHRTQKKYALHLLHGIVQLGAWFDAVYDA